MRFLVIAVVASACTSRAAVPSTSAVAAQPEAVPALATPGAIAVASHTCVRTADAKVWCWGWAEFGELATSDDAFRTRPIEIAGLPPIAGVAAGSYATCAWTADGAAWCWGTDGREGYPPRRVLPQRVPGLADVATMDLEVDLACALRKTGSVVCWTPASFADPKTKLVEIAGIRAPDQITVGGQSACARTGPKVTCWSVERAKPPRKRDPDDRSEQASADEPIEPQEPPETIANAAGAISIAIGVDQNKDHLWALMPDGRVLVIAMKSERVEQRRAPAGAKRIDAGDDAVCVVGRGVACGSVRDDDNSPLEVVPGLDGATDVRAGGNNRCARTASGEVACWGQLGWLGDGRGERSGAVDVPGIADAVQLAAGGDTICARRTTGEIACWGQSQRPGVASGTIDRDPALIHGVRDAVELAVGYSQSCVRRASGAVTCWHKGAGGAPRDIPKLAGATHLLVDSGGPCGLVAGKATCESGWRDGLDIPVGTTRLWVGFQTSCATVADGTTRCRRRYGKSSELGNDIVSVAFGILETCYVRAAGTIACRKDEENTSREIRGITNATTIVKHFRDYCALLRDGTVTCWDGEAPTHVEGVRDAVELVANDQVACVRKRSGAVMCWGDYDHLGNRSRDHTDLPIVVAPLKL